MNAKMPMGEANSSFIDLVREQRKGIDRLASVWEDPRIRINVKAYYPELATVIDALIFPLTGAPGFPAPAGKPDVLT